jgi:hypothetical protein
VGQTITYPNGQTLTSSALTPAQINVIIQSLTCGMIGIPIPVNPGDTGYAAVRVSWQQQGEPFQDANDDVCYILCTPQNVDYSRIRDRIVAGLGTCPSPLLETWLYTKGWNITWHFYGPNSEDRARAVRSAMFMDYANDQLSLSSLFPVNEPPEVVRLPQEINGQWFEYAEFHIDMYEQVTETVNDGVVTIVEVKVYEGTHTGPVADFTVSS